MSRTGRRVVLLTVCALSAGVATVKAFGGFGEQGATRTITTTVAAPTADVPIAEAGPLPALPRGWRRVQDPRGGFSVGLPPGWSARRSERHAGAALARSHARDRRRRRPHARPAGSPRRGPTRTRRSSSLRGYRGLRATGSRPLRTSPYPGAQATATGTYADTGVEQAITLVALQRRGDATYTLLAFRSAQSPSGPARRVVDRVVDTLHSERPA